MRAVGTDVGAGVLSKSLRDARARCAPVNEFESDENFRCLRIVANISHIGSSTDMAVMRVNLDPAASLGVMVIDVVTESLFQASGQVWLFLLKSRIVPVLIKGQDFRHLHCENDSPPQTISLGPSSDNPVADLCPAPNLWLARGQSASSEEGVWGKPKIPRDHVGI